MNVDRITEKLNILADAAKYDVSCASSGSKRKNENKGLGNASNGICHSYTEDGRCVSLLKILLTNHCIFDCAYCVSRKSNDIQRAAFTVQEVVDLTINFYRRNYIEGLVPEFGIFKDADYTMERLVRIAKKLRTEHNFNGYIHLKSIPGASDEFMNEAGLYADRLSVNLEMPTEAGLKLLAPDKNQADMIKPMGYLKNAIIQRAEEKNFLKKPLFLPRPAKVHRLLSAPRPRMTARCCNRPITFIGILI
jgi:putative DNA modification/repair radical SAM protein